MKTRKRLCSDHHAAIFDFFWSEHCRGQYRMVNICYNSCISRINKYRSHMNYTNNTDVITTRKSHHGDECEIVPSSLSSSKAESTIYQVKVDLGSAIHTRSKTSPKKHEVSHITSRHHDRGNTQRIERTASLQNGGETRDELLRQKFSTERN